MKHLVLALAIAAAAPAYAGVGVSIQFSQPGVYGRVDIGAYPQPQLIVPTPVIIGAPVPRAEPVYLWVPPGQRQHWRRYCRQYNACGVPVYFVRDDWYGAHVRPHHDERRDDRRDDRHDNRRDDHRDDHRGRGNDHRDHRGDRDDRDHH